MSTKRFDQLQQGDVMVWNGSDNGAHVIETGPQGVVIRWTTDSGAHTAPLAWRPGDMVNLEGEQ